MVHICVSLLNQQTVYGGVEGLQARLQASLQAKLAERQEKRSNGLARSRASHSGNDRDQHTNTFRTKIQSVIGRVDGAVALHDAKAAGVHQRVGATSEYTEATRAVFMERHGIHSRDSDGGQAAPTCPFAGMKPRPQPSLRACRIFSDLACCTEDAVPQARFINTTDKSRCHSALLAVSCHVNCSPRLSRYLDSSKTHHPRVRLCMSTCEQIFNACQTEMLSSGIGSADYFCSSLESLTGWPLTTPAAAGEDCILVAMKPDIESR